MTKTEIPNAESIIKMDNEHIKVLESVTKCCELDPDICAALEPLTVALMVGCPDFRLYHYPMRILQEISIAGRNWMNEGNEYTWEMQEFVTEINEWMENVERDLKLSVENGTFTARGFLSDNFSQKFLKESEEYRKMQNAKKVENIGDFLSDDHFDQMFGSLDPEDYN